MSLAPPPPRPRPIDKVSPSLGESLVACQLRVAFARDTEFADLDRPNSFSALGLVAHMLTEEFAQGRFGGHEPKQLEAALGDRFDQLVEVESRTLETAHPSGPIPPPERWPGYRPTRRRLLRRLSSAGAKASGPVVTPTSSIAVESEIEAPDLPLHGRPDRVEQDGTGTHLVDLKTGWGEMSELRPAHRRQLLIYSYIWHAIHGEWPVSAAIQRLDGSRIPLDVDPVEAEAVVRDLLDRRLAFNEAIEKEAWSLASPSSEACENCSYRAACPPFFAAVSEEWQSYRRSLLGRIMAIETLDGSLVLNLAVEAGNLPMEVTQVRILGVPARGEFEAEEVVGIVDVVPTRIPSELRVAWDSCVYSWTRETVIT